MVSVQSNYYVADINDVVVVDVVVVVEVKSC